MSFIFYCFHFFSLLSSFHPPACSKQGAICKKRHKTDEKWWRNALTDDSSGRQCFFIGVAARELISRTFPPSFGIVPLLWIQIMIEGEFITQILISACALFSCLLIRVLLFARIKVRSERDWMPRLGAGIRENFIKPVPRDVRDSGLGNELIIRLLRNARIKTSQALTWCAYAKSSHKRRSPWITSSSHKRNTQS